MKTSVFVSKLEIDKALATAPTDGKRLLEPIKSLSQSTGIPFNILEDVNITHGGAEVHLHEDDLWLCLSGEVTFTVGGEMVDPKVLKDADGIEHPNELQAEEIKNGEQKVLKTGDWLWIPAGQPHQHHCSGAARLAIIKIPKKD